MRVRSAARTDVGRRRPHNEDSFVADDRLGLYVVADGVGGQAKGEVASAQSVELVHSWIRRWRTALAAHADRPIPEAAAMVRRLLDAAVQSACYMVFGMGLVDPSHRGMSTTVSALLLSGPTAFIAHVGDSRIYLKRDGRVEQLTRDHTLFNWQLERGLVSADDAAAGRSKNVITRAVGRLEYVETDLFEHPVEPGDRFMLCSDGLHGYLQPEELRKLLAGEPEAVVSRLVDVANERGGRDNITAIVCDVAER
jgi:protein phosphatase